ncbi:hypothetical protein BKI52_38905 [marine bacterium AO1-C]|nr:hypothetical protein BKI52_38905 [marine bacterium AO1-C]
MKRIVCIVPKDMFSKAQIQQLDAGFQSIYKNNYSHEKVNVFWMLMPKGYAYAERKPSEATIIMVEVNEDITRAKREELLSLYSRFLLKDFNISPLDAVITVANASFVQQFSEAQKNRVHRPYRPWINLKTMATALTSKIMNGYYRLRVKM